MYMYTISQYYCQYCRLHDQIGVDSLTNSLLLKIFSYLDPKTLCRCAQVGTMLYMYVHVYSIPSSYPLDIHRCVEDGITSQTLPNCGNTTAGSWEGLRVWVTWRQL